MISNVEEQSSNVETGGCSQAKAVFCDWWIENLRKSGVLIRWSFSVIVLGKEKPALVAHLVTKI